MRLFPALLPLRAFCLPGFLAFSLLSKFSLNEVKAFKEAIGPFHLTTGLAGSSNHLGALAEYPCLPVSGRGAPASECKLSPAGSHALALGAGV